MPEETFTPEPRKPRLIWSGKSRRKVAEPLPTQVVEVVTPQQSDVKVMAGAEAFRREQAEQGRLPGMRVPVQATLGSGNGREPLPPNRLIWTNDNLTALTALLHGDDQHEPLEGRVDLIYIDPPFAVQSDFDINVSITDDAVDERMPTLIEELAYSDTWKDGLDSYLAMLRDRLELMKQLLSPTGSIFVHCDWHAGHYIRVMMDELFGYENFINEIIWRRAFAHNDPGRCGMIHDAILFYSKSSQRTWNRVLQKPSREYVEEFFDQYDDERGERYNRVPLDAPRHGEGGNLLYEWKGVWPSSGRTWAYVRDKMEEFDRQGRIHYPKNGIPRLKRYESEYEGTVLQDLWFDINKLHNRSPELTSFPTQKPVALLQRIVAATSNPNDLVLDAFSGSGTTALAAETMKNADGKPAPRRWIAIDCGKFAIHITRKRLIEAGARPFAVENVGFYARGKEWRDLFAERPEAKVYRDALVTIYGGTPIGGFAHLHGRKGSHWVHVGPLDAPVAVSQVEAVLAEAAETDLTAVDILSADVPIDFSRSEAEEKFGVRLYAKVIPAAAVDAVRDRLKRKKGKDAGLELAEGPPIHFFSPPDVEVGVTVGGTAATVKLLRLTVDLDDCLSTQDAAKRAQIRERITDWRALVDYWAVDWDYKPGEPFRNDWQTFRTRKNREIAMQAAHDYGNERGEKLIAVKVTDVFGNVGLKVARVVVG